MESANEMDRTSAMETIVPSIFDWKTRYHPITIHEVLLLFHRTFLISSLLPPLLTRMRNQMRLILALE